MMSDMQERLDQYLSWLRDETALKELENGWFEITTPHLDRHNDCLQIYVKQENGTYVIKDDGYIINDLANSGCKLDSPKRQKLLQMTLAGFGVENNGSDLTIRATKENFPVKKHNLLQAMLAVNDLFYLAQPLTASFFLEDVEAWMNLSEIRYTPRIKLTGTSGYDHVFNFVIPRSSRQPERILQAINNPDRSAAESLVFKWMDTRQTRDSNSRCFAILNNQDRTVSSDVNEALMNYEISPIIWSNRDSAVESLAA